MEEKTDQQLVEENLNSEKVLNEWGIPSARRWAKISFVILVIVTIATVAGAIAYLLAGDPELSSRNLSGFIFVLLLAAVAFVLRIFQLRAQRKDIERFVPVLKRSLTGDPQGDIAAQQRAEEEFEWKSRPYTIIVRMVVLAMLVLIAINTYQGNVIDLGRQLVFDGCIAIVVASFAFDQLTFRAELLYEELRVRLEATVRYQRLHPVQPDDDFDDLDEDTPSASDASDTPELLNASDASS